MPPSIAGPSRTGLVWPARTPRLPLVLTRAAVPTAAFSTAHTLRARGGPPRLKRLELPEPTYTVQKFGPYTSPTPPPLTPEESARIAREQAAGMFTTMNTHVERYRTEMERWTAGASFSPAAAERPRKPASVHDADHDGTIARIRAVLSERGEEPALSLAHRYLNAIWEHSPTLLDAPKLRRRWKRSDRPITERLHEQLGIGTHKQRPLLATRKSAETVTLLQETYGAFAELFLAHDPPAETAAYTLLHRQVYEGVPLSPANTLRLLEVPKLQLPLPRVLALMPPMDPEMLGRALQLVARQTNATPEEVRQVITLGLEADGRPTESGTWHPALFAAVIEAYTGGNDFRHMLKTLDEFKATVKSAMANTAEKGEAWPEPKYADMIINVYTAAMNTWIVNAGTGTGRSRTKLVHSDVPSAMATDLVDLLTPNAPNTEAKVDDSSEPKPKAGYLDKPHPVDLPCSFLATWMSAERYAENISTATRIWVKISGVSLDSTLAGIPPVHALTDHGAWRAMMKLVKLTGPSASTGYRGVARIAPPYSHSELLAATAMTSDLPLVLVLLATVPPARRPFDVASAALLRSMRVPGFNCLPTVGDPSAQPSECGGRRYPRFTPRKRERARIFGKEYQWLRRVLPLHLNGEAAPPLPLTPGGAHEDGKPTAEGPSAAADGADAATVDRPQPFLPLTTPAHVTANLAADVPFAVIAEANPRLATECLVTYTRALVRVIADALVSQLRAHGGRGSDVELLRAVLAPVSLRVSEEEEGWVDTRALAEEIFPQAKEEETTQP